MSPREDSEDKIRIAHRVVLKSANLATCAVLFGFAFSSAALGGAAAGQTATNQSRQAANLIYSIKGPDLFRAYCAACHGPNGKGSGPAAGVLKAKVPDLTMLAKENGGEFPSARVGKIIVGDVGMAPHGSREMLWSQWVDATLAWSLSAGV